MSVGDESIQPDHGDLIGAVMSLNKRRLRKFLFGHGFCRPRAARTQRDQQHEIREQTETKQYDQEQW